MISYANISLPDLSSGQLLEVAGHIAWHRLLEPSPPLWPGPRRTTWSYGPFHTYQEPARDLQTLRWPQGASRWATGHYFADGEQLDAIRDVVYGTSGTSYVSATLKLTDDASTEPAREVETAMYLLPPRPVDRVKDGLLKSEQLWLLRLVDVRYLWWQRRGSIFVAEGNTEWADLFEQIGTILGVTLTISPTIEYGFPGDVFNSRFEALPLLLDLAASTVGRRVVRKLDGTVVIQGYTIAAAALPTLLEYPRLAGGEMALTRTPGA